MITCQRERQMWSAFIRAKLLRISRQSTVWGTDTYWGSSDVLRNTEVDVLRPGTMSDVHRVYLERFAV